MRAEEVMAGPSRDGEGMGPLERGRNRYQQKKYLSALESFTEAIQLSTGHLRLTTLDHRAATYEKLNQLQAALRDSKQMIDLKPDFAKGYLRCAKVLQLKGEKELALKIYERGLTKVKIGVDNDRTILQSMYNKLRRAQDPGKTLDPLQFLPLELAEMVIQSLEMRDRVICLAVSKPWKRLLESSHKLWTTFDTTSARKPVSQHSLKTYLKRSNYTLDKAIINSRAKFDAPKMIYLTKTCKNLHHLEINGTAIIGDSLTSALSFKPNLTKLVVSENCEISLSAVQLALQSCQETLVDAAFLRISRSSPRSLSGCPKLESMRRLHLQARELDGNLDMEDLLSAIPNIKSLTMIKWGNISLDLSRCNHLEEVVLSDGSRELQSLPLLPPTIRSLNVSKNTGLHYADPEACKFPWLETFDCSSTALSSEAIEMITRDSIKAGKLKVLKMGASFAFEDASAAPLPASDTVVELSLASLNKPEQVLIDMVNLYPNVRSLDISFTCVTGVAIKHFVNMGIKQLKVNECGRLGPDAVEFARGKGVEVQFNFPSRSSNASFRDRVFPGGYGY